MNGLRRLGLLFVLAGVAVFVVGTGAFTAVEADRPMHVSVVDSEDAHLGLAYVETAGARVEETVTVATITNRFHVTLTRVTVTIDGADQPSPAGMAPGDDFHVDADVCEAAGYATEMITLSIDASEDDVSAVVSRDIRLKCEGLGLDVTVPTDDDGEVRTGPGGYGSQTSTNTTVLVMENARPEDDLSVEDVTVERKDGNLDWRNPRVYVDGEERTLPSDLRSSQSANLTADFDCGTEYANPGERFVDLEITVDVADDTDVSAITEDVSVRCRGDIEQ